MKLLVDAHVFDGKYQGTRTYIEGLYREAVKYKDIAFYFAANDIEKLQELFGLSSNIHYIQLHTTGSIARLCWEFPKIIKKYKIDYAHFQYISPLYKCCKEIVTIHDLIFLDYPQYFDWKYKLLNGWMFKRSAKRANVLLTVSEWSKKAIEKHFHVPLNKITITSNCIVEPHPIPTDIRKRLELDRYLMTVSRIEPRKNQLMLLKAFVNLSLYNSYKLVFVGVYDLKSKDFDDYYNHLSDKIRNKIVFCSVSYDELIELYKYTSLFVFPSYAEGFGIPPLEAIVSGAPVLCSNVTAMKEFNLPDAFTFSPYNIKELEEKIKDLLSNRPNMENVKKKVLKEYKWDNEAAKLHSVIVNLDNNINENSVH